MKLISYASNNNVVKKNVFVLCFQNMQIELFLWQIGICVTDTCSILSIYIETVEQNVYFSRQYKEYFDTLPNWHEIGIRIRFDFHDYKMISMNTWANDSTCIMCHRHKAIVNWITGNPEVNEQKWRFFWRSSIGGMPYLLIIFPLNGHGI